MINTKTGEYVEVFGCYDCGKIVDSQDDIHFCKKCKVPLCYDCYTLEDSRLCIFCADVPAPIQVAYRSIPV